MDLKKLALLTVTEVVFFALIILTLVFVRYQSEIYLNQVDSLSPQLELLKADLQANNVTEQNQLKMDALLTELSKISDKSLRLNDIYLPLFFIIASILFQIIYWKLAENTHFKKIILPVFIQSIIFLITTFFLLNTINYLLYFEGSNLNIYYLLIASIFLVISTLFNFFYFSANKSVKMTIKHFFSNTLHLWLNIPILMLFFLIPITFSILVYVFSQVNISIIPPIVLIIIFSLAANIHRIYLIDKIQRNK